MTEAIETWAPRVGAARACRAFGVSPRTWRHRRQHAEGRLAVRPSKAIPPEMHKAVPWKIPEAERDQIRAVLCSDRFADLAPAQVYATLLDEGTYLCSERSMYRMLHENDLVGERRRGACTTDCVRGSTNRTAGLRSLVNPESEEDLNCD